MRNSSNTEAMLLMDHQEHLSDKEYIRKFRMFFTGLIFAVISFISSNPIETKLLWVKITEFMALVLLLLSGLLLLEKLSGARVKSTSFKATPCKYKLHYVLLNINIHYWVSFVTGMILLVLDRGVSLLWAT